MTVAFVTLFLGLTLGIHPVAVDVSPEVSSVRIVLDGREVGTADGDDGWRVPVDFGDGLSAHELEAVAYDASGKELDRTRQPVNLPRSPAEAELVIERDHSGSATAARLSWESLQTATPRQVRALFDGRPIPVTDPRRIELPPNDPASLHFLRVELEFSDLVEATVEATFGGTYQERTAAELTAVPVSLAKRGDEPTLEQMEGWLATADGSPLTPIAIEKAPADVVFILERSAQRALWEAARNQLLQWAARGWAPRHIRDDARYQRALQHRDPSGTDRPDVSFWRREMLLHEDQVLRILWPYAVRIERPSSAPLELFPRSPDHPPADGGVFWILSEATPPETADQAAGETQRLADAAAVAGMTATGRARRRAVVLVLGVEATDSSRFDPASVRNYLAQLGVPLEVWVVGKPSRSTRQQWGDSVRRVADTTSFARAVEDLARRLERQRIVWVPGRHLPQAIVLTDRAQGLERVR